jgi:methylglutaconyl-CoA hydratase
MVSGTLVVAELQARGVLRLKLNRPGVRNALDDTTIEALGEQLDAAAADDAVRVVELTGAGNAFCAGADFGWMRRLDGAGEAEARAGVMAVAGLLQKLRSLPKPTLALVNGPAIGAGAGLVACADIAIASDAAVFALPEVRLGFVPGVVPFVVDVIGRRHARRIVLTGERIGATEARRIGLVHDVVPAMYLDTAGLRVSEDLLQGGPQAQAAAKAFLHPEGTLDVPEGAALVARLRAGEEGREGLAAAHQKRRPGWR